jgi:hypothetical protein
VTKKAAVERRPISTSAGNEEPLLKDEIMGSTPLLEIPNHQTIVA